MALQDLPHVGSVINGDDEERVVRLFEHLAAVIEERRGRYEAGGAALTLEEYRRASGNGSEPRILLLLDGFTAFRESYDTNAYLQPTYARFQRILADGRSVGVHVGLTADRPGAIPTAVLSPFGRRVVMRLADAEEYASWGLPKDVLTTSSAPGRAIQVHNPQEIQLAVLGRDVNSAAQAELLADLARSVAKFHHTRPEPIKRLPDLILGSTAPRDVKGLPVLGMRDSDLTFIGFDPVGAVGIAGLLETGRTNATQWMVAACAAVHPDAEFYHLGLRPSRLSGLGIWRASATNASDCAAVAEQALQTAMEAAEPGQPRVVVAIEALTDHADGEAHHQILELIRTCRRRGHLIIGESETSTWTGSYNELSAEIRGARRGLILVPEANDGDTLFKTTLPRFQRRAFPTGRGFWIHGGRTTKVQVPLCE